MDFAKKLMGKYGWKEGEGLGKNNNGISKPLKATLKFDNAGFGNDVAASDFNNHWWERVFNEASNNVEINQDGQDIKLDLKDKDDGVEISTKGYSMKKLKKAKTLRNTSECKEGSSNSYENFLQSSTLTNVGGEVENPNKIDASDIAVTKIKILTDEELFNACGGRTAHKGARHGLKLSGKLARIEQQEKEMLAKLMAKQQQEANQNKKKIANAKENKHELKIGDFEDDMNTIKSKKKRKHEIVREQEGSSKPKVKKSNSNKSCQQQVRAEVTENDSKSKHENEEMPIEPNNNTKTKKKKKTCKEDPISEDLKVEPAETENFSKKMKNKRKHVIEENLIEPKTSTKPKNCKEEPIVELPAETKESVHKKSKKKKN